MDRNRFDRLTRLFATTGSRRRAVSALITAAILGHDADILAKKGNGKGRGDAKSGKGKGRGDGKGGRHRQNGKGRNNKNNNKNR